MWLQRAPRNAPSMTIYKTFLLRGYFPKELPPSFFTDIFAQYATTKKGSKMLAAYAPADKFTECVAYRLALPGSVQRDLGIPHPASFADLARLTAKHFHRLLKKAGRSPFSKSRPVYATGGYRALHTSFKPSNLARERAIARAGGSYVVKADVNHFYPSLYTHAIGWAIDPILRQKAHWHNKGLLGKKVDQAILDLQGKVSLGVPIGNDISYLLAEIVLAQVDRALRVPADRAYRWFDDYEISCDTIQEAERVLLRLTGELRKFRLRINANKTAIRSLPMPAQEEWQQILMAESRGSFVRPDAMVSYFDAAFRLRARHPESQVLTYALGLLFRIPRPHLRVERVAFSCLTQALLSEPGVAQKAFSLLSFWILNGLPLERRLLARTIGRMMEHHRASGVTSDVSWALAFCIEHSIALSPTAGEILSKCDDDCIALQALHCKSAGLLKRGFKTKQIARLVKDVDLDGPHWLLGYEALRQGFLNDSATSVNSNSLFKDLLTNGVTFYRTKLPNYAIVVHPGGAPEWTVKLWLDLLQDRRPVSAEQAEVANSLAVVKLIGDDLQRLDVASKSPEDTLAALFAAHGPELSALLAHSEPYAGASGHSEDF
jgi:hypothetical protein